LPIKEINKETLEYELEGDDHAWITVGNLSVYIKKADEGVAVDIYPKDGEDDESIAGTWALFQDAEPIPEDPRDAEWEQRMRDDLPIEDIDPEHDPE